MAFRKDDDTMALQWKDKWVVTMLSSVYNMKCEDIDRVLHNAEKKTVAKPIVISQYTKNMSGVDRADQYCGT